MMNKWNRFVWNKCVMILMLGGLIGCGDLPDQSNNPNSSDSPNSPNSKDTKKTLAQGDSDSNDGGDFTESDQTESIGLRLVSEDSTGQNPNIPDAKASIDKKSALDNYTLDLSPDKTGGKSGNTSGLILHTKIFLPDLLSSNPEKKKEYFFVWGEKIGQAKILSAQYSHRVLDSQGKLIGTLNPRSVWHDTTTHRWFIPISEIFKNISHYGTSDVNLDDTQILSVEFVLESGKSSILNIRFQASGPYPHILLQQAPINLYKHIVGQQNPTQGMIHAIKSNGIPVLQDEVTNPFSRPFHIWVRSKGHAQKIQKKSAHSLSFDAHFSHVSWTPRPHLPPKNNYEKHISTGEVEVDELAIEHQSGQGEIRSLQPQQWEKIILEPNEKLILSWKGHSKAKSQNCTLPQNFQQQFDWTDPPSTPPSTPGQSIPSGIGRVVHFGLQLQKNMQDQMVAMGTNPGFGAPPPPPVNPQRYVTDKWSFSGVQLHGHWKREIRLAHTFIKQSDATQSSIKSGAASSGPPEYIDLVDLANQKTQFSVDQWIGILDSNPSPYSCQGFF